MNRLKPIRSFVRRERKLGQIRQKAVQELWGKHVLPPQEMLAAQKLLNPINIEIGFGMGDSLFAMALANPNEHFIGIEIHLPGVAALLTQLKTQALPNISIYNHDAIEILNNCIPDNCIDKILLFFPDPWPKRRHHKRRIVQPDFVKLVRQKLKSNGCFHAATDIENYASHIINTVTANSFTLDPDAPNLHPPTKFEQRGIREGRKIWDLVFVKNS